VTKSSLILTIVSLLSGCVGSSSPVNQAVTAPSSPCNTVAPSPSDLVTLILTVPATVVSGTTAPIKATGVDAAGNRADVTTLVTWSSSNFLAASADKGKVYGIGVGSATITATIGEVSASADLSILPITLEALSLHADAEVARAGITTAWHVTGRYNDGSTVDMTNKAAWSSSDQSIVAVDQPGQIRAVATGMAMITASADGLDTSAPMLVTDATLTGLRIDSVTTTVSTGAQTQLTATGLYSDGSTADLTAMVGWYTSDGSVATVWQGRVMPLSSGTVTISAATDAFVGALDLTVSE